MRYSEYIEECALSLAELSETPFDSSWIHFVRLSRIGAEIRDTLTWHQDTPYCTSEEEMKILVKSFEQKLSAWHASIPVVIEKHGGFRFGEALNFRLTLTQPLYALHIRFATRPCTKSACTAS